LNVTAGTKGKRAPEYFGVGVKKCLLSNNGKL
jgi:hypothetical protein